MKLIRYATAYLHSPRAERPGFGLTIGDVAIRISAVKGLDVESAAGRKRVLLEATVDLPQRPDLTEGAKVIVPEEPRRQAESAIESVADVLSVLNRCARSISSPRPFVALLPEDAPERQWLEELSGFEGRLVSIPAAHPPGEVTPETVMLMSDRADGASLMAEAMGNGHATGRYREFIRLFERAFTLPPWQFEKKLAQFLKGADLGYDRAEVRRWVELRNPATHADDLTRPFLVLESHARPVIARMEQAAFDVLYNKEVWRDPSRERRSVWSPTVATVSSGRLKMTQGKDANFTFQILDPFEAYPMDASFRLQVPSGWWSKWPVQGDTGSPS